jgi:hypothetical protein
MKTAAATPATPAVMTMKQQSVGQMQMPSFSQKETR